jgi:outer membrane protein, heavy metal efflux system
MRMLSILRVMDNTQSAARDARRGRAISRAWERGVVASAKRGNGYFQLPAMCAVVVAVAGCATTTQPQSGFDQVQRTVLDRTGQQVVWNTSSADDGRADAAVGRLLESPLTPDIAVQIALLGNPSLQANFENLGIAQADFVRAGLLKNPVFNGAYEFASGGGLAKVNLSVTEDFLSILQIPLRKRVASAALESARLEAADACLNLSVRVRSAFYEYEAAQQILALRNGAAAARNAAETVADRLHQAGNLSDLDLANEQVMSAQSDLDTTTAAGEVSRRREDLNELMGLAEPRAGVWKSDVTLPEVPAQLSSTNELEALAMRDRLDLAAAKQDADESAGELGVASQFALFPDFSGGASAEREHDGTWETGPEVSVPIPLFDLGGASVAAARARMRQAQRRFQAMKIEVQSQVRRAVDEMTQAEAAARCYRENLLPARQQIVKQTMLRYDGMLASVFQLLSAKEAQLSAQAASINVTRDFWIAAAELERAVGGRLP